MTSPPLDYTKLREIAEKAQAACPSWHYVGMSDPFAIYVNTFKPELVSALLADNARKDKALAVGRTLADAVRLHGYPVSDEHWRKSSGSMSHQARALHLAAAVFRQALEGASQ